MGIMRLPKRFITFLTVFQTVLIAVHGFLFLTWVYFLAPHIQGNARAYDFSPLSHWRLLIALTILSVSFLATSLIGFRLTNVVLRFGYRITAVWLGFVNYAFFSSVLCWLVYLILHAGGARIERHYFAWAFLGLSITVSAYGVINSEWTRVTRIAVKLPRLPESWCGRTAVLVSDVHLGNYRAFGFIRRVVKMMLRLKPDVVFIAGDLYDGTPADLARLAEPLRMLKPPLGTFFVEGNHEEFSDPSKYTKAIAAAGVRVLDNERQIVDGVQIVGVTYWVASHGERFRKTLLATELDPTQPSILLTHAPDRLQVAADEGISLQLSGHTHGGQFWPWTLAANRMYGKFVYGLQKLGALQVYTSHGAGTWGPPLRLGTSSELVLIRFE